MYYERDLPSQPTDSGSGILLGGIAAVVAIGVLFRLIAPHLGWM